MEKCINLIETNRSVDEAIFAALLLLSKSVKYEALQPAHKEKILKHVGGVVFFKRMLKSKDMEELCLHLLATFVGDRDAVDYDEEMINLLCKKIEAIDWQDVQRSIRVFNDGISCILPDLRGAGEENKLFFVRKLLTSIMQNERLSGDGDKLSVVLPCLNLLCKSSSLKRKVRILIESLGEDVLRLRFAHEKKDDSSKSKLDLELVKAYLHSISSVLSDDVLQLEEDLLMKQISQVQTILSINLHGSKSGEELKDACLSITAQLFIVGQSFLAPALRRVKSINVLIQTCEIEIQVKLERYSNVLLAKLAEKENPQNVIRLENSLIHALHVFATLVSLEELWDSSLDDEQAAKYLRAVDGVLSSSCRFHSGEYVQLSQSALLVLDSLNSCFSSCLTLYWRDDKSLLFLALRKLQFKKVVGNFIRNNRGGVQSLLHILAFLVEQQQENQPDEMTLLLPELLRDHSFAIKAILQWIPPIANPQQASEEYLYLLFCVFRLIYCAHDVLIQNRVVREDLVAVVKGKFGGFFEPSLLKMRLNDDQSEASKKRAYNYACCAIVYFLVVHVDHANKQLIPFLRKHYLDEADVRNEEENDALNDGDLEDFLAECSHDKLIRWMQEYDNFF